MSEKKHKRERKSIADIIEKNKFAEGISMSQQQQMNALLDGRMRAFLLSAPPSLQINPVEMCKAVYFQAAFECLTANFAAATAEPTTIAIHELIALQWEVLMRRSDAERESDGSGHGDDGTSEVESEGKDG